MNKTIKIISLIILTCYITPISYAQKKNETSAAVEFKKKYLSSLRKGDLESAKKALISAKGKVSGEEFGKLARAYINKDLAMYVQKLDFAGALDFMLQKTTIMPPKDRKNVVSQIMALRKGVKDAEKMSPDQAVATHGTDKQKAKLDRLNKKNADLDKQISRIDNRTLDGVPVGQQAKKDFEKKVTPRTPYAMAKGI